MRVNTLGEAKLVEDVDALASKYTIGEPMDFTVIVDVYPEVPVTEEMCARPPAQRGPVNLASRTRGPPLSPPWLSEIR